MKKLFGALVKLFSLLAVLGALLSFLSMGAGRFSR